MSLNKVNHLALIMDGNQRWALINKKNKLEGYLAGLNNLKFIIDKCIEKKIKNLTVYALSSENIKRASSKIIFNLIIDKHKEFLKELLKNNIININIIGEKTNIPKDILNIFKSLIKKKNPTINLNIVFNYGSLDEIVYIVNNFIINKNKKINKNSVRSSMYLGNIPDPDILIRTGGYQRLSNFILLNLSYTELFFTNTLWPDFSHNELESILLKFSKVNRNYGL
ncbi:MAG: polyprenyl diphosphate synthase [Alphaproteobacteria bacterium]|nr:polyprenyl diphosphate synthase [Alphaproteobacteria bacterium]PPR57454.1 MAG: Isoprenyl transferase [Alphaproteobacteria bacterium MarineAlpha5_Bin3]